jgi:ankyrin repeat protein
VNQADDKRKTSLFIAAEFDQHLCVELLIESKAFVNPFASTTGEYINQEVPILWIAAFANSKHSMKVLLSVDNIDLNVTGPDQTTPLIIARSKGHEEIEQILAQASEKSK